MALYQQSNKGMAVAPHAAAAEAGAAVLAEGGNAIEACVAMATTLAAVYPHMTGLGGDSFWLLHQPGGPVQTVMGVGRSALGASLDGYRQQGHEQIPFRGPAAALTVAGTVSGIERALQISQRDWDGALPPSRLFAEAIGYCRDGYTVTASQADAISEKFDQLAGQAGFAETFLVDGAPPSAGSRMRQSALADTLERLVNDGFDDFYRGELARDICSELAGIGSPLRAEDFARHQAYMDTPVTARIGNADLYASPAPTQGPATLMILGLFARRRPGLASEEGVDMVHGLVEATKQAYRLRGSEIRDPALMSRSSQSLLDAALLDSLAARIDPDKAADWGLRTQAGDTTWFGAIDAGGRSASCIQSIYHEFGSGLVLPGTGLNWQNRGAGFSLDEGHPLALKPATLPFHTLCPSMAHFDDGRRMVFGTMGGDGQPQTQACLYTRYADYGQALDQAVAGPRWLLGRTWGDASDNLKLESRFPPKLVDQLRKRGHDLTVVGDVDAVMGHAGAIVRHPDGRLEGASDPRSDGAAAGG